MIQRARIKLDPQTIKQLHRFRSIKRGYWSAVSLTVFIVFCLFAELLVNSRALVVSYEGEWYFPTYGAIYPGTAFGEDYKYETNYRELQKKFAANDNPNWVLMPPVPFNPLENDLKKGIYPPYPPSIENQHYLGTDTTGRDVLARLVYGFRIAMGFAFALLCINLHCRYYCRMRYGLLGWCIRSCIPAVD